MVVRAGRGFAYLMGLLQLRILGRKGLRSFARVAIPLAGFAAIAGLLLLQLSQV
jgi:hypothetical protein